MSTIDLIEKELNECDGYAINIRLVSLTNSFLVYQANVNQLKSWYKKLNDLETALIIWNPDNFSLMEQTNLEMQRLFSNFLSSAFSLRDHLYTLRNKYYKNTPIDEKVTEAISKYYKQNNLTTFIREFRNFVIHCGYPKTSKTLSHKNGKAYNDIFFDINQLLKWDGWTSPTKKFFETINIRLKLIDIVIDYDKINNCCYTEIFDFLKIYHKQELKALKIIEDKYGLKLNMVKI